MQSLLNKSIIKALNLITITYLSFRAGLLFERMLPLKLVLLAVGPVQEDPLPVPLLPPEVPEEMGVLEND